MDTESIADQGLDLKLETAKHQLILDGAGQHRSSNIR